MNQAEVGKFIAALRRERGLTQQALGERLGVTNKTISRWENGNYLPDIEMLGLIGREFDVSIEELIAGKRSGESTSAPKESAFSLDERRTYLVRKWRREHIALFVLLGAVVLACAVLPFVFGEPGAVGLAPPRRSPQTRGRTTA